MPFSLQTSGLVHVPQVYCLPPQVTGSDERVQIAVKEIDVAALAAELGSGRSAFAIGVAKVDMVPAILAV